MRIISAIAKKNAEASYIVIDLSKTTLKPRDFGNIITKYKMQKQKMLLQ